MEAFLRCTEAEPQNTEKLFSHLLIMNFLKHTKTHPSHLKVIGIDRRGTPNNVVDRIKVERGKGFSQLAA